MKKTRLVLQAVIIIGAGIAALVAFTTTADAQTLSDIYAIAYLDGSEPGAEAKA